MPRVKLREMRKSPSMVPTKTDRAVKLLTPTVVRELPGRSGKRHATSRWASRSYCHTREALLRCITPRRGGSRGARWHRMRSGPSNGLMEKFKKIKMRNRKNGSAEQPRAKLGPPQKNRPGAIEWGDKNKPKAARWKAAGCRVRLPSQNRGGPMGALRQALADAGNGHRRPARAGRRRHLAFVEDARDLAS
jgi:hypothetical protein